ncbi:hypothetical protein ACWD3I_16530 [Streptomyces sp. NPDC002817]|uniref:hypothetical protein n=1 Tax=Streptomyces sp. NPDC088357 TaxID=3154655 RepID=UPI003435DFDB
MRALVSRGLLVPPLICAALIFGPAGTAAAVGDAGREVPGLSISEAAPHSGAETDTLLDHDGALAPLLDTVADVGEVNGTRLAPEAAAAYAEELRAWNLTVQERLKSLDRPADRSVAADPVGDLLSSLTSAVQGLISALTSLDLGGVLSAVTGLLSPVLGLVTGLLGGGLPEVPALPVA